MRWRRGAPGPRSDPRLQPQGEGPEVHAVRVPRDNARTPKPPAWLLAVRGGGDRRAPTPILIGASRRGSPSDSDTGHPCVVPSVRVPSSAALRAGQGSVHPPHQRGRPGRPGPGLPNHPFKFKGHLPCEHRLAVGHKHPLPASMFRERGHHLAQSQQGLVDAHAFLCAGEKRASVPSHCLERTCPATVLLPHGHRRTRRPQTTSCTAQRSPQPQSAAFPRTGRCSRQPRAEADLLRVYFLRGSLETTPWAAPRPLGTPLTLSCCPQVPAGPQRSLPARSTRLTRLVTLCSSSSPSTRSVCGNTA